MILIYIIRLFGIPTEKDNYAHQPVERKIVNLLKDKGYDILCLHTDKDKHYKDFPFRHGITICQIFKKLV